MKKLDLEPFIVLAKGILSGEIKLFAELVSEKPGKKSKKSSVSKPSSADKPEKKQKIQKSAKVKVSAKAEKVKDEKKPVEPREVMKYLHGKRAGEKISSICSHFEKGRKEIKPILEKLLKKSFIEEVKGVYFLKHRMRGLNSNIKEKVSVNPKMILDFIRKNPASTLEKIGEALGNLTYQKLIYPIRTLVKSGKIRKNDKEYSAV
ncbi:MAG: hypothetical protein HQM10_09460 [Candidatus Riflebacteria bacterium]|nr:hypothetical protein [Candidatus Riflebacteria bacterium]